MHGVLRQELEPVRDLAGARARDENAALALGAREEVVQYRHRLRPVLAQERERRRVAVLDADLRRHGRRPASGR